MSTLPAIAASDDGTLDKSTYASSQENHFFAPELHAAAAVHAQAEPTVNQPVSSIQSAEKTNSETSVLDSPISPSRVTLTEPITQTETLTTTIVLTPTTPITPRSSGPSRAGKIYYVPFIILNVPTAPPVADFVADKSDGYAPLTVDFQNLSIDARASTWDFGDGTTSTDRDPSHVYPKSGTYTVTLTVDNDLGSDSMTRSAYIVVNDSEIDFRIDSSLGIAAGTAPMTVTFSSILTGTLGRAERQTQETLVERYIWDFGDGHQVILGGEGITATHVYSQSGVYSVTVTAETLDRQITNQQQGAVVVTDPNLVTMQRMTPAGGHIASADGRVRLDFAPDAIAEDLYISIDHIDMTEVTTNTVDGEPRMVLPPSGIPVHMIDLLAHNTDNLNVADVTFSAPVTLTYLYSQSAGSHSIEDLIDPSSLHFELFDETTQTFEPLTSTVTTADPATLQPSNLATLLSHFSTYGVTGDQANWVTPSIDAASVQLSRGSSSYGYPIPLPAGPGGFVPQMALQYSSGTVNNMVGDKNTDTGWVGLGWSLDLGHISGNDSITLNSISGELRYGGTDKEKTGDYYYLESDTSVRIRAIPLDTERPDGVKEIQNDVIYEATTKDGTIYTFGKRTSRTTGQDGAPIGSTLSARWRINQECKHKNLTFKLAKVQDIHGNTLEIHYQEFEGSAGCQDGALPIVRESYPSQIRYTTNANAGDTQAEYLVDFEIAPKGFNASWEARTGDGSQKLKAIHIYHLPQGVNPFPVGQRPTESWEGVHIRTLDFTYDTNPATQTNLLTQLKILGTDGANTLPATTFSYTDHELRWRRPYEGDMECGPDTSNESCSRGIKTGRHQRAFLTQITNGYGGKVGFTYAHENLSKALVDIDRPTDDGLFLWVTSRTLTDTVTGLVGIQRYYYHQPTFKWKRNNGRNVVLSYGRFFGFGIADEEDPLNRWTRHHYYNAKDDILNGREFETWAYEGPPDSGKLLSASQSRYVTPSWPVPRNVGEDEEDELVRFVFMPETWNYQCEGQTTDRDVSSCIALRSTRAIDNWGNPTAEATFDASNNLFRHVKRTFVQHPTQWLFRTASEEVFDQTGTRIGMTWSSYDGQPNALTQTLGDRPLLTHQRAWAGDDGFIDVAISEYDAYGNPKAQTAYNGYGNENTFASADARTTSTNYGPHGIFPLEIINPLDHKVTTEYDYRFQQPIQVTDPNKVVTKTEFDPYGRTLNVTLPEPAPEESGVNGCGQAPDFLATYGDNDGLPYYEQAQQRIDDCTGTPVYATTTVLYDGLGRKIQAQTPGDTAGQWIITDVAFDNIGRLIQTSVPYAAAPGLLPDPVEGGAGPRPAYLPPDWATLDQTVTTYDEQNRPTQVMAPDKSVTKSSYALAAANDTIINRVLTSVTDSNDHQKEQVADEFGRLVEVREFTGGPFGEPVQPYATTSYAYDNRDNLTQVTDAHENKTTIGYDVLNRKVSMIDPDMGTWSYEYDPLGNLIGQRDASGTLTTMGFDPLNRLTNKAYTPGNDVVQVPAVTYVYDEGANAIGRLTRMNDGVGGMGYTYDPRGRILAQSRTFGGDYTSLANSQDNGAYLTAYRYDAADRILATVYPDGEEVATSYTQRGLPQTLRSITHNANLIQQTSYNHLGQMTNRLAGNGIGTDYSYYSASHQNNRLEAIQIGDGLMRSEYDYDAVGNITKIVDTANSFGAQKLSFSYDHLDRLIYAEALAPTSNEIPTDRSLQAYKRDYVYDEIGNILSRTLIDTDTSGQADNVVQTYGYDENNKPHAVRSVNDDLYDYDANGNMTTRKEDGVTYTQYWNPYNKLARVEWQDTNDNNLTTRFVYDGDGNRLLRIEDRPHPIPGNDTTLQITTVYIGQLFEKQFNTTATPLQARRIINPLRPLFGASPWPLFTEDTMTYGPIEREIQPVQAPDINAFSIGDEGQNTATLQSTSREVTPTINIAEGEAADTTPHRRPRGLAAPFLTAYSDSATFTALPNPNVWDATTGAGATGAIAGGAWRITRAQQFQAGWVAAATLTSQARVNLSGAAGTSVSWTTTLNSADENGLTSMSLHDTDAQRYLEVDCRDDTATTFTCNYRIRNDATAAVIRDVVSGFSPPAGGTFQKGAFYTFELRYKGSREVALTVDGSELISEQFSVTEWNNINWVIPRWNVAGQAGETTTLDTSLDEIAYTNATDNDAPLITLGGATQDVWLSAADSVTISALDGPTEYDGSGVKCLKAQWDSAITGDDTGCYTTSLSAFAVNQEGSHTLYVKAWDWAGNVASSNPLYKLDTVAPTLFGTASTSAATGCDGAISNAWQNTCNDANFTWSAATDASSNIDSYKIYWGTSATGVPTISAISPAHNPGPISSGDTYYLRVSAQDEAGNSSAPATLFILKYDNTPPTAPTSASSGCSGSVVTNVWQNLCDNPAFTWSGATDSASGVASYQGSWGSAGIDQTGTAYNPDAVDSESSTTLQVEAVDGAGNVSPAATLFVFKYDGSPPSIPGMNDEDEYTPASTNEVSWDGATDSGAGGVQYQVRRASDAACSVGTVDSVWKTGTTHEFTGLADGVTYYYCVHSKDSLGNTSGWSSRTSSTQDASPPGIPVLNAEPDFTGGSSNDIAWGATADGGFGNVQYRVRYSDDDGFPIATTITSNWQSGTTFTTNSLINCTEYFYQVRSKDGLGNESSWSGTQSSTQDASPPAGSIEIPSGQINGGIRWITVGQVSLSLDASDDCAATNQLQMQLQNEDGNWANWGPFEATKAWNLTSGDGPKTVTVQFQDGANNVSTGTIQAAITQDSTKPVVPNPTVSNIIFSPNGDGSLDDTAISATLVEANPVDWTIEVQDGTGTVIRSHTGSGMAVNWVWDGKNDGAATVADGSGYSVRIQATDAAGNSETSASTSLQIDTAPPALSLTHPTERDIWEVNETIPTNQNVLLIEGSVGTTSDIVTVNSQAATVSGDRNAFAQNATLTQGANIITVVATDVAGNQTTATRNVIFDDSVPTLSSVGPTAPTQENTPLIRGTFENAGVGDGSGVAVDINQVRILRPGGVDVTASSVITSDGFSYEPNPPLLEGLNTVRVEMVDTAGNFGAYEWSFEVDRSTAVQIQQPQTGSVLNNVNQAVSGQGEANANLTLTINGTPAGNTSVDTNGNFAFPTQALVDSAASTLVVSAIDSLGNTAVTTATVYVNSAQPGASVNVAPNPFSDVTHFGLSASAPISASVGSWSLIVGSEVITGNIGLPPASWTWDGITPSGSLPDGAYGVTLIVTAANNSSTTATIATAPDLIRDTTPPAAPIILFPQDGAVNVEPSTLVTGTAEPNSVVTIFNNGLFTFTAPADGNGLWQLVYPLEGGLNNLTATATDPAGHESGPSAPVTIQVVVEPPLIDVGLTPGMAGPSMLVNLEALSRGAGHPDGPSTASVTVAVPDGSIIGIAETAPGVEGTWTGSWTVDPATPFGPHVLTFEGTDTVGLVGQGKSALFVDPVPPNTPRLDHPVGDVLVNLTQIPFVGKADPLDTIVISINGTLVPTLTVQADAQGNWELLVPLLEGLNTIEVNARDLVGNLSTNGPVARITRDTVPPAITGWPKETPLQTGPDLFFRANITDTSDIGLATVEVADGTLALIDFATFWERVRLGDLTEAIYPLTYWAQDAAGNTNTTTNTLTIDNTPPLVNRTLALQDTTNARIISDSVWFGTAPNSLTISVATTDTLAGLSTLDFGPSTLDPGLSFGYAGETTATENHVYPINSDEALGRTIVITATDLADNLGYAPPTQLLRDVVSPTIPIFYLSTDATFTMLDGNTTLVYGPQSTGALTVTIQTRDSGIGLGQIAFPNIGFAGADGGQQAGNGITDLTEFNHVYAIDGSQNVSGTFALTVTDWVNNSNVVTFTIIRDETPPEIRGEAVRPFIQSSNDLTFDAWITDTYPIAEATVTIDGVSTHDLLDVGNNWTATRPGDLTEAVYPLTFSATDQLGNTATATNTLIVADTDPTVDLSVVTTEPYGEVISNTMYFGKGDGTYTVTAEVSTPLAGLDTVEFADATSAGILLPQNGLPSVTLSHEYTFTVSSTFSNTVSVTAIDRAANTTISGIPVIRDIVSPTVSISAQSSGLDITLSWSASDESSGLESCSLKIAVEGNPEEELSTDCSGSMVYPGTQDVAHVFKLTVFDKVFNDATATASTTPNSVTKYYYLGTERVAMKNGDGVFYLHGDHLGSTSLTTDEDGEVVSEKRYYPYGEERFADGSQTTDFTFTGQRAESGFGLMDYNARLYSPRLGKFISPDIIVPDPSSPLDLNRYLYTGANPLNYVDPTGHCRYEDTPDGQQLVYSYDCSVDEFHQLSWNDRIDWMNAFMSRTDVASFYNINGILEFFRDDPVFSGSDWASYSDAGVLEAIQDGYRISKGETPIGEGGAEWAKFFDLVARGASDNQRLSQWGDAEQAGVNYGVKLAERFRGSGDLREEVYIETFVAFGNAYRALVSDGRLYTTKTPGVTDPLGGPLIDAALAYVSRPLFDPSTQSSQGFVRDFSRYVIAPTASTIYGQSQAHGHYR